MRRFEPGEAVALRDVLRGRIWTARPVTVVRDADDGWMFHIPPGTRWFAPWRDDAGWLRSKAPGTTWGLRRRTWSDAHVLSFAWPGCGHAVLYFWDQEWRPRSWYVNVEVPLRRWAAGFDTLDQDLDVVIEPDRSAWRWKDEEDVEEGVRLGTYTREEAAGFRREAERGLRRVLDREPPFDRDWATWRPDPSWPTPTLPEGWDRP
ncbi:MAG TPA: DUF402 domain-containing protein [Actinomycetota bacterium]|jgi:hypothetical protein|nr:DUF402 domain-containing protein [Actinomycetota bacterium]